MEEKKLDLKTIVGFGLIMVLLLWMVYNQTSNTEAELQEKEKQEQIDKKQEEVETRKVTTVEKDSTATGSENLSELKNALGAFAYSATLPSAKDDVTELKNGLLTLNIANKGGYIKEATLNDFEQFHRDSKEIVNLI